MAGLPGTIKAYITSRLADRKLESQLMAFQKVLVNILFFFLTVYFLMHMIFAMWPLLLGFLFLYYLKKGLCFKALDLSEHFIKVGMFLIKLCVNIMGQIMRFVSTF